MSFYTHKLRIINNAPNFPSVLDLSTLKGKTVLIVNVASACGFTKQYAGLQALYASRQSKDFVVVGVPCNQFGKQEPGTEQVRTAHEEYASIRHITRTISNNGTQEIANFCSTKYNVTFPITEKVEVNGPNEHPLFKELKAASGGRDVAWNFGKCSSPVMH
jgi:glutathione peroxidase-family protein